MDLLSSALTLPMSLAAAGGAFSALARRQGGALVGVAAGHRRAAGLHLRTRCLAQRQARMLQVVIAVLASGLLVWIGAVMGWHWLMGLGVAAWFGALALDLLRWERVAVSASNLWFQRGLRERVHQIAYENIRDVHVEEKEAGGFACATAATTRVCRLQVRMKDKRIVAPPKTDAFSGLGDVEEVANQLRQRPPHGRPRGHAALRGGGASRRRAHAADTPTGGDDELRRALNKLRAARWRPTCPRPSSCATKT